MCLSVMSMLCGEVSSMQKSMFREWNTLVFFRVILFLQKNVFIVQISSIQFLVSLQYFTNLENPELLGIKKKLTV